MQIPSTNSPDKIHVQHLPQYIQLLYLFLKIYFFIKLKIRTPQIKVATGLKYNTFCQSPSDKKKYTLNNVAL